MVSAIRTRLKDRKFLLRLFSFLSAFIIVICLGTVTAYAADDETLDFNEAKGYYDLSGEPNDGEDNWNWPLDGIYDSIRLMLYNADMLLLDMAFDQVDDVTAFAKDKFQKTPEEYQSTIFTTVDTVAKKVIMPIATVILTYVVLLDFMQGVMEKNNFHEFDTSVFIRWIIKTTVAVYFVSNATTIVNAFFDLGSVLTNSLVTETSKINGGNLANGDMLKNISFTLCQCGIGTLISILLPILVLSVISWGIYIVIYVIMIGRMVEIYLHISVAPMPLATITNREFGESGKNYLKIIFAFVLQLFFILLCICIYGALVNSLSVSIAEINLGQDNVVAILSGKLFEIIAYGVILVFTMLKSNGLAKSILGAH